MEIRAIVQRTRSRYLRSALATWPIGLVVVLAASPAGADTVFQADGGVDLGYTTTTLAPLGSRRLYLDLRPALLLQGGSPRLVWRTSYAFSGSLTLSGTEPSSYSNQLGLSLAAELSRTSMIAASVGVTQGGSAFQLTQSAPEVGQPAFRAPGSPDLITATAAESFAWETSPHLRLGQGLSWSASAPRSALGQGSHTLTGSVSLDRLFPRDAVGAVLRSGYALARPIAQGAPETKIVTNSLVGSWNHDFDPRWNGQATAGVEHAVALTAGHPTTIVPTGSLTARWSGADSAVSLSVTHGAETNLQTGTESLADRVTLRGTVSFERALQRQLGASVGFLHARPLGDLAQGVSSETGNAAQADVGFVWSFSDALLGTARYSVAYQFGGGANLTRSLIQVALVGLAVRYGNARYVPPVPTLGGRVDAADAVGFPGSGTQKP